MYYLCPIFDLFVDQYWTLNPSVERPSWRDYIVCIQWKWPIICNRSYRSYRENMEKLSHKQSNVCLKFIHIPILYCNVTFFCIAHCHHVIFSLLFFWFLLCVSYHTIKIAHDFVSACSFAGSSYLILGTEESAKILFYSLHESRIKQNDEHEITTAMSATSSFTCGSSSAIQLKHEFHSEMTCPSMVYYRSALVIRMFIFSYYYCFGFTAM